MSEQRRESNYIRKSCDIYIEMLMNAGLIKETLFIHIFLYSLLSSLSLRFCPFRFFCLCAQIERRIRIVSTNDFLLHLPVNKCVNVSICYFVFFLCMNLCVANRRKLNFIIDARKILVHARTHTLIQCYCMALFRFSSSLFLLFFSIVVCF